MGKKLTYGEVKQFVEENSECELLSDEYLGIHSKMKFKCRCGKIFETSFSNFKHNDKRQCNSCGKKLGDSKQKRITREEVEKFVKENSNCKLLSKKVDNYKTKLLFKCKCGNEFETTFINFKYNGKKQCNDCSKRVGIKKQLLSIDEVKKRIETTSKCKLLSKIYEGNNMPLKLQCECGQVFETDLITFEYYNKKQCNKCSRINLIQSKRLTFGELRKHVEENSNCKLLGTRYITNGAGRNILHLELECECGEKFITSKGNFDSYGKKRCDKCSDHQSKYEYETENTLKKFNIRYKQEKTFPECKYKQILFFDFYLPDYRTCIEVDGQFHFEATTLGNDYINQVKRDKIKNKFCSDNNIKLIRIPYWDIDNIEKILIKELNLNNPNKK